MRQVDSRHVLTTMMSLIVTNETSAQKNVFVQQNSLSQCHNIIKCCFSSQLVVLVVLAGAAQATPGGGYGKPKCRTVYETSYTTSYEEKCSTSYEQQCSTSYEEQCSTSYEQECSTSYETSYEKSCSTTYEKVKKMVLLIFARFPLKPQLSGLFIGRLWRLPQAGRRARIREAGSAEELRSLCSQKIFLQAGAQAILPEQTCAEAGEEVQVCAKAELQPRAKGVLQVCAKGELQIGAGADSNQGGQAGLLWRWKFPRIRRLWRIQGLKMNLLNALLLRSR